jgi:OmpA-OmpF porin, OOP family
MGGAQATEGWYGRLDVGRSIEGDLDGAVDDGETTADFSPDLEDAWMGSTGLGYAYQNGFRLEGEVSVRHNQWGPTPFNSFTEGDIDGEATAVALMGNLIYDFNRDSRFQPYLGVGVGVARVSVNVDGYEESSDRSLAYQGMAGFGYALTDQLTLDLGYRYFKAPDINASEAFTSFGIGGARSETDYEHQAVTLGVRWQFASAEPDAPPPPPPAYYAPPPPPPVAAVCPASEFVVYFEWDRANLNQAAMDTIQTAADRAKACNVNAVVVVGHTDSSGSSDYNAELSEQRASVVSDALRSSGISSATIRTEARGESELVRATGDGVREPLNRRTAVTISFR